MELGCANPGCNLGLKGCRGSAPYGVQLLSLAALELRAISGFHREKVWRWLSMSSYLSHGSFCRWISVRRAPYSSLEPLSTTEKLCLQSPVCITGVSTCSNLIWTGWFCAELSSLIFHLHVNKVGDLGQISPLYQFTQVLLPVAGWHWRTQVKNLGEGCTFLLHLAKCQRASYGDGSNDSTNFQSILFTLLK